MHLCLQDVVNLPLLATNNSVRLRLQRAEHFIASLEIGGEEESAFPFNSVLSPRSDTEGCSTSCSGGIRYKLSFKSSSSMKKVDDVCSGEGRWSRISPDSLCHREGMSSPSPSSVNPPPSFSLSLATCECDSKSDFAKSICC